MMGKRSLPLDRVSKEKQTHPLRLLPDSSSVLVRSQEARGVSLSLEPEPGTGWGRAGPPPLQQEAQPPDPAPGGTLLPRSQRPADQLAPCLGSEPAPAGRGDPPPPWRQAFPSTCGCRLELGHARCTRKNGGSARRGVPPWPPPMLPQPVRPAHWAAAARTPHFPWSREHVAPCRGYGPRSIATARVAKTSRHCCCFKAAKETFAPTASPCGRV